MHFSYICLRKLISEGKKHKYMFATFWSSPVFTGSGLSKRNSHELIDPSMGPLGVLPTSLQLAWDGMGLCWDWIGLGLCWECIVLDWDCVRMGLLWDWDVKRIKLHSQYQLTHALDGHTRPRYAIQGPANCFMNNRANNCRQEKGAFGS